MLIEDNQAEATSLQEKSSLDRGTGGIGTLGSPGSVLSSNSSPSKKILDSPLNSISEGDEGTLFSPISPVRGEKGSKGKSDLSSKEAKYKQAIIDNPNDVEAISKYGVRLLLIFYFVSFLNFVRIFLFCFQLPSNKRPSLHFITLYNQHLSTYETKN